MLWKGYVSKFKAHSNFYFYCYYMFTLRVSWTSWCLSAQVTRCTKNGHEALIVPRDTFDASHGFML